MNLVARCFEEGWGTARNRAAARNWYRKSADGGYFRGAYNYASILASEGCMTGALWFRKRSRPRPNRRAPISAAPSKSGPSRSFAQLVN